MFGVWFTNFIIKNLQLVMNHCRFFKEKKTEQIADFLQRFPRYFLHSQSITISNRDCDQLLVLVMSIIDDVMMSVCVCVWQMANGECQRWAVKKSRSLFHFYFLSCSKIVENKFYVFIHCVDLFNAAQQQKKKEHLKNTKLSHRLLFVKEMLKKLEI